MLENTLTAADVPSPSPLPTGFTLESACAVPGLARRRPTVAPKGGMSDENPRTTRDTLKRIGYATALVSGSAAAVYTLSSALRRHDLSAIRMLNKTAAPPPAMQREVRGDPYGSESEDSDEDADRKMTCPQLEERQRAQSDEREKLKEKMDRAVRAGHMRRVQDLAGRIRDLEHEQAVVRGSARRQPHRHQRSVCDTRQRSRLSGRGAREPLRHQPANLPMRRESDERKIRECDTDDARSAGHDMQAQGPQSSLNGHRRSCYPRMRSECNLFGLADPAPESDGDCPLPTHREEQDSRRAHRKDLHSSSAMPPADNYPHIVHRQHSDYSFSGDDEQGSRCTVLRRSQRNAQGLGIQQPCASSPSRSGTASRKRGADAPASTSALEAESMLKAGDLVKAECPFTHELHDATVQAVTARGLVEVRWHNPGMDQHGRPFSRYGDVWADRVQIVFRKDSGSAGDDAPNQESTVQRETEERVPRAKPARTAEDPEMLNGTSTTDGLRVGDECYARGRIVETRWFKARVLAVRSKTPPVRVEYLETFEGEQEPLLLPQPRKVFVHEADVCLKKPAMPTCATLPVRPASHTDIAGPALMEEQNAGEAGGENDGGEPIDEDLMCSVCCRPDDEAHMLVCGCKRGYHTYCLVPKLTSVPAGEWRCPHCSAAGHA